MLALDIIHLVTLISVAECYEAVQTPIFYHKEGELNIICIEREFTSRVKDVSYDMVMQGMNRALYLIMIVRVIKTFGYR